MLNSGKNHVLAYTNNYCHCTVRTSIYIYICTISFKSLTFNCEITLLTFAFRYTYCSSMNGF